MLYLNASMNNNNDYDLSTAVKAYSECTEYCVCPQGMCLHDASRHSTVPNNFADICICKAYTSVWIHLIHSSHFLGFRDHLLRTFFSTNLTKGTFIKKQLAPIYLAKVG